jgi:formyltetrahydrofolate-dependent phosphoribosylglycinamide formyltransferase
MNRERARIAVFISGGGSNLQSLINASKDGRLCGEIAYVVSSSDTAYGLQRAAAEGIETFAFSLRQYGSREEASANLLARLKERQIDYIALAGYLKMVPGPVLQEFPKRVVNIHPALLPKYGGKGMYGHFVHEAVLTAGDKVSGVTVHIVDEIYDHGAILEQAQVPVMANDTADTLAARVLVEEHKLYPKVLDKLIKGEYKL